MSNVWDQMQGPRMERPDATSATNAQKQLSPETREYQDKLLKRMGLDGLLEEIDRHRTAILEALKAQAAANGFWQV